MPLALDMQAPPEAPFAQVFAVWQKQFEERLREKFELGRLFIFHPCLSAGKETARAILEWCERHGDSAAVLEAKLDYVIEFTINLYDALTPREEAAAARRKRFGGFWSHISLKNAYFYKSKSYRDEFLDRQSLKALADRYLDRPWMHNSYLDWVFTDALMAAEAVATYEWFQDQRGGFAYAIFKGNKLKAGLLRWLVLKPLTIFLSWVAPGLFFWWLYGSLPKTAVIAGALYYVINVGWVVVQLALRALYQLRGGKSFRQKAMEINLAIYKAYDELREPTIHVPSLRNAVDRARDSGVAWDPQVFCILDNVAQRHPSTWTSNLHLRNEVGDSWEQSNWAGSPQQL
jgi:hypothetical protein